MKKLFLAFLTVIVLHHVSSAQWTTSGTNIYNSNTGNVGIGTTSPTDLLTVVKADNTNYNLHISNGGGSAKGVLISGGNTGSDATLLQVTDNANTLHFFTVTDGNSYFQNGHVGFGTTAPAVPVHVLGTSEQFRIGYDASNYASFTTNSGGTLIVTPTSGGISFHAGVSNLISNSATSTSPHGNSTMLLQLANTDATSGNTAGLKFMDGLGVVYSAIENIYTTRTSGSENAILAFTTVGSGTKAERMRITQDGNIAIGTLDPKGYKLAVNGSAIATSMTVKLNANWPDYVFKPEYKLPLLSDVKTYVDQNQHLPEMPSEAEIERNGQNLGEINQLLTKKVEELTLYLIELDKTEKQQQEKIAAQEERINKLEKAMEQLSGHK